MTRPKERLPSLVLDPPEKKQKRDSRAKRVKLRACVYDTCGTVRFVRLSGSVLSYIKSTPRPNIT